MPFFSVIIPTHNRYASLKKAIDSVLAQTYTDYQLLVIDDGSTDETPSVEHEYAGKLKYIPQEHSGVSAARNRGIVESASPWLTFLDSDDTWLPHKLTVHHRYINSHGEAGRIHQVDETWIRKGKRVNPRRKHAKRGGWIFPDSLHLCLVSPSAVAVKRDLLEETGLFDEKLPACEDYDLWLRIAWKEAVGYIPQYLVTRNGGHDDQLSSKYRAMDRFRVYAICKLLNSCHRVMPVEYVEMSMEVALEKLFILQHGAGKRGNNYLVSIVENIVDDLRSGNYSSTAYQNLLEELTVPAP